MRTLPLWLAISALVAAQPLRSQQAPATATAVGTVFDSVRLRPLAGARVMLDTTGLFTTTDALGRFQLAGIPAGAYQLRVEHPALDTMGIDLRSERAEFVAGSTTLHEFGTPSPERIIELVCPAAWRARGPAALTGRVREADTGNPATGARVSLVWYEVDVGQGLRRVPRVREAGVGPDGIYRICGLPAGLDGRLQVSRGTLTSGDIAVSFGEDLLALRSMSIAASGAMVAVASKSDSLRAAPAMLGVARLTGRVRNKSGAPLAGARVQVEGTTRATSTRPNGEFTLDSLPPGTQSVAVRLLGYAPAEAAVDLSSRETRSVTITMEDFVPTLEAVRVTAQRERALDAVGFARRKRSGMGFYMEGDEIRNRNALNFSDVVRSAPGIRVATYNGRQVIQSARDPVSGCVMVYVDGTLWQQMEPGDVDDFVKPHEIGALEVYSPTATPAEYQTRGGGCTTIVAWTNRRLDRRR